MFAALELGVFEAVSDGATLEELQEAVSVHKPRLLTLLTALTAHGMLVRSGDGVYTLTAPVANSLVQGSRHYYGDYLKFQIGRQFYRRMTDLGDIMASGEAPTYSEWFADSKEAGMYTRAQHNGSVATAKQLVCACRGVG